MKNTRENNPHQVSSAGEVTGLLAQFFEDPTQFSDEQRAILEELAALLDNTFRDPNSEAKVQ